MKIQRLKVYQKDALDKDTIEEIKDLDKYLCQTIYETGDYDVAIHFLEEKAKSFINRGVYTDIYYKIFNLKNRALDFGLNPITLQKIRNIYDVYSECIYQKDYRNAVRMLRFYQSYCPNHQDLINLQWANLYTRLSDFEKAEEYLDRCKESQEENPNYILTVINLLFKKKEYQEVIAMVPLLDRYDGRTNYKPYMSVAKAYLLLDKNDQAEVIFSIVMEMILRPEFSNQIIERAYQGLRSDYNRIFPTKSNLSVLFDIAYDEGNVEDAERYLKGLLDGESDESHIQSDQEKIKKLGELKEAYKEVN